MLDELQRVQVALHDMLSQPDLKKINFVLKQELGEELFI